MGVGEEYHLVVLVVRTAAQEREFSWWVVPMTSPVNRHREDVPVERGERMRILGGDSNVALSMPI